MEPLSYLEFNFLVEKSMAVITDSGGITEETTFMNVPCITLRENTERPETVTMGTNVLVGNDSASQVYIKSKEKAFEKLNCHTETFLFSENSNDDEIILLINQLNEDPNFHGILIQLPLPKKFNTKKILHSVNPNKDVDGLHPYNLGLLLEGNPNFIPCTPNGIIQILKFNNISTEGKHAVIIGRSNIVGKPMFALLAQNFKMGNSTVTICHTRTKNLKEITSKADILIAAVGVPNLIDSNMVKEGVDIVDVGINRVDDDSVKGYKLVGDVDIESIYGKARSITPVPGGVGPLTIRMLISNTVNAAKQKH